MTDASDSGAPGTDDRRLLEALGRALPAEPLPAGFLDRAEQLLTYLDVDRELAELLAQPAEAAGMRGGGSATDVRQGGQAVLAFRTPDGAVAVDVTVDVTGDGTGDGSDDGSVDGVMVSAQVLAGAVVEVALQTRSGAVTVGAPDELGRCTFRDVPPGPARLTLRDATAKEVVTDWFLT